jgi:hypothetical protein
MTQLHRLLAPGGIVFFQMPDTAANPVSLLMGDQYHYFTFNSLAGLLRRFGFALEPVDNPWFPREIVAVAHRPASEPATGPAADRILCDCLSHLDEKARQLAHMKSGGQVSVLGTTFSAAFVDNLLGDAVFQFVDEALRHDRSQFRAKPVAHPRELGERDLLVIPYGASGGRIQERFRQQYRGRTVVV